MSQPTLFPMPEPEVTRIRIIELWPIEFNCGLCGDICFGDYSLPMFEGEIVSEDHPEWGGQIVCKRCFEKHGWKSEVPWYERAERRRDGKTGGFDSQEYGALQEG
jgi:hypothetical protein